MGLIGSLMMLPLKSSVRRLDLKDYEHSDCGVTSTCTGQVIAAAVLWSDDIRTVF